jgi:hypothetical protein
LGDSFHRRLEILSRLASAELNACRKNHGFVTCPVPPRNCFRHGAMACQVNLFLTRIVIQQFGVNDFLNEEHR